MGNQPCGMLFRQIELLVLLAGAVHSLSLSTQKTDLIFGSKGAAQAWQGTYNMTHADKILPADSAPCKQIFGADPLWSESSPHGTFTFGSSQTKCSSAGSITNKCVVPKVGTIIARTVERWSTRDCATCRKLLWKLPYPKLSGSSDPKKAWTNPAFWLKAGERYLDPRQSCTSCKEGSVLVLYSVQDRVGRCMKFIPTFVWGKTNIGYGEQTSGQWSFIGKKPYVQSTKIGSVVMPNRGANWGLGLHGATVPKGLDPPRPELLSKAYVSVKKLCMSHLGNGAAIKSFTDAGVLGTYQCSEVTCNAQKQVQCFGAACDVRKTVKCVNVCQAYINPPDQKCSPELCNGKFGHIMCKEMTSLL